MLCILHSPMVFCHVLISLLCGNFSFVRYEPVYGKAQEMACASSKTTVMIQSFWLIRSGQTVQTQIRLLLEEQSDQGLHCLLFHLHLF